MLLPLILASGFAAKDDAKTEAEKDEIVAGPVTTKVDPAAQKFWQAIRLLQSGKAADLAAGRTALQAVADSEYTHAQVLLGNCLASGSYGFTKDARKAANYFRLAAERGNAFAKVSLGSCYAYGSGVRKDEAKAVEWLSAALAPEANYSPPERPAAAPGEKDEEMGAAVAGGLQNDPIAGSKATAHYVLGEVLSRQNRLAEAQVHYVAAATAGVDGASGLYGAATQAALNYAFGRGVPRDMAKATEMLDRSRRLVARQQVSLIHNYVSLKMVDEFAVADLEEKADEASENQQTALQMNIATLFGDKKSKDYNAAEAARWYELAAENGQVWAMLQVGLMHARGETGQKDPGKAFAWFEKAGGGDKPKHLLGVANLAICLQNGFGTPKDEARAAAIFRKYRENDIVCYLGSINQSPTAPMSYEEVTALLETWAKKGDPTAQYLLGVRYLNGWGVKADRDDARKWFTKAAKAKQGAALCALGVLAETEARFLRSVGASATEEMKRAADYYRQASEAGNIEGLINYADILLEGRAGTRDLVQAEAKYLACLAADPSQARAHCNLAVLYEQKLRGVIDTVDWQSITEYRNRMLQHYEESVRLGFAQAAQNLGGLYYEGKVVPRDFAKAYRLTEQAVEFGQPTAHFQLGHMHEFGQGVPVTLTEAAYHYRLAALEGHIEALRRLINFYMTGTGVSLDLDRAVFWLQQMIQRGNPRAIPTLCDIWIKKGDYANAVPLLRKLTEERDSYLAGYGYDRLAYCYANGLGVKADAARAKRYGELALKHGNPAAMTNLAKKMLQKGDANGALGMLMSAASGSPEACFILGNFYFFGTNVAQDRAQGIRYLRRAAEGNSMEALYFLAALTYNREPDAPTLAEAIRFAQQAESGGHPSGAMVREKLEQRQRESAAAPEEAGRSRSL